MMNERKFYASDLHFNTEMSYEEYKKKMSKPKKKSLLDEPINRKFV